MPWVAELPNLVRFIGISELLGGIGVLLPAILRIKPMLTPLAALGLVVVQIFAAIFHLSRGEMSALPINFFLMALAAFVLWGRYRKLPIQAK